LAARRRERRAALRDEGAADSWSGRRRRTVAGAVVCERQRRLRTRHCSSGVNSSLFLVVSKADTRIPSNRRPRRTRPTCSCGAWLGARRACRSTSQNRRRVRSSALRWDTGVVAWAEPENPVRVT